MSKFPSYTQLDTMDCGPTSLRIVAAFYGKQYSLQTLREKCHITREGVSLLGISDAAEGIGFRTASVKLTWIQLRKPLRCPASYIGTSVISWSFTRFERSTEVGGCMCPTRPRDC